MTASKMYYRLYFNHIFNKIELQSRIYTRQIQQVRKAFQKEKEKEARQMYASSVQVCNTTLSNKNTGHTGKAYMSYSIKKIFS